jgi:hypothetical protein
MAALWLYKAILLSLNLNPTFSATPSRAPRETDGE